MGGRAGGEHGEREGRVRWLRIGGGVRVVGRVAGEIG